jgi:hypothetical protein
VVKARDASSSMAQSGADHFSNFMICDLPKRQLVLVPNYNLHSLRICYADLK